MDENDHKQVLDEYNAWLQASDGKKKRYPINRWEKTNPAGYLAHFQRSCYQGQDSNIAECKHGALVLRGICEQKVFDLDAQTRCSNDREDTIPLFTLLSSCSYISGMLP